MPRHDDPVVDTVQTITESLTAYQIDEEDADIMFDVVYEETTGSLSQLAEYQWRVSYTLDSDSLEEPVGDEWEAFTDAGEEFARTTYRALIDAVEAEFPAMDVDYTPVEEAVASYHKHEGQ
jgi:hypothetical protein